MLLPRFRHVVLAVLLLGPAQAAASGQLPSKSKGPEDFLVIEVSDKDSIVLLTTIEYGAPDRLSFTSEFAHDLPGLRYRDYYTALRFAVAPGLDGVRLKAGLGTYSHAGPGFHGDVVLMRTWSKPLRVEPNQNWVGAELRVTALVSLGIGYYQRVSGERGRDSLFAVHAGIGF